MKTILMSGLIGCLSLAACKPKPEPAPVPPPTPPVIAPHDPVIGKELMITDLTVVNDPRANGPDGTWSFGGLIKAMSGSTDPGRFVLDWLKQWETDRTVNSLSVPARQKIRTLVIEPWKTKDGQAGVADGQWTINLANAPFRLLAIVNRLDLNRGTATTVENAGEGRFVFGLVDASGAPQPFTVIFEYEQPANDRPRLRGWAQSWHALGTMDFGPAYNAALQQITDRFSGKDRAPGKPNGNPLNQIRTNEIRLVLDGESQRGWELREFHIVNGRLEEVPTLQTPGNTLQNSARLANFINANEVDILDRNFTVPLQFENAPFLAGSSIVAPPTIGFSWKAPGVANREARHIVALTSCNGCHHVETGTTSFLHVSNRQQNAEAILSGFLKGIQNVPDPETPSIKRSFNDLADRAILLKSVATEIGDVRLNAITRDRRSRVH